MRLPDRASNSLKFMDPKPYFKWCSLKEQKQKNKTWLYSIVFYYFYGKSVALQL